MKHFSKRWPFVVLVITVIALLFLLALFFEFKNDVYGQATKALLPSCVDADAYLGANSIYNASYVNYGFLVKTGRKTTRSGRIMRDYCANSAILMEAVCKADPRYGTKSGSYDKKMCVNGCKDKACIRQMDYSIEFGDPLFFKPSLHDETFRITIMCKKGALEYDCEDQAIGSKISRAYAYITNSSGVKVQEFDLVKEIGVLFNGTFDYDSLTEDIYKIGVYAEDINGVKKEIPAYNIFSGQGWNLCNTNSDCQQNHSCINSRCILDNIGYQLGLVYIYYNEDTYNPGWRTEFEAINQKVINGIKEATNNKVSPTISMLGEVQTDIFCWNPARVGAKLRNLDLGGEIYIRMPGSDFSSTGIGIDRYEIVESYCDNCVVDGDLYKMDCEDGLSPSNLWESDRLSRLNQQISQELGFNFDDYDGVFIVFGKLGHTLPDESNINLQYLCSTFSRGVIGGYSNLIMAENSIKSGGLTDCGSLNTISTYERTGWHMMVHEILHRFGAVDVYDTGTVFGYDPSFYRNRARLIDPKTDESIMGNEERECKEKGGVETDGDICTNAELESIYLDKYNRQKVGIG